MLKWLLRLMIAIDLVESLIAFYWPIKVIIAALVAWYAVNNVRKRRKAEREKELVQVVGQWGQAARRFMNDRMAIVGLIVLLIVIMASLSEVIFNHDGYMTLTGDYLVPPSWHHLFGTTQVGIDLFSAVMKGILVDIRVAVVVSIVTISVGTIMGAIAGYFGGKVDAVIMQIINLFLIVPGLSILIVLSNQLKTSSDTSLLLAVIVGLLGWTYVARLVRAEFLSLRTRDFVEAARALGAGRARIIARHMLPNTMGPIVVNGTLTMAGSILLEATLSFLGLGIQPPEVSLGALLQVGQDFAQDAPWCFLFPAGILLILILSIFFVGDGLQSALDPRKARAK